MNKSVIIHGPAACGKTYNSKKIAEYFGLSKVVEIDEMSEKRLKKQGGIMRNGVLYITNNEKIVSRKAMVFPFSLVAARLARV